MKLLMVGFLLFVSVSYLSVLCLESSQEEVIESIGMQLKQFDVEFKAMWWLHQSADWSYSTNITKDTTASRELASEMYSEWMKKWKLWARSVDRDFLPTALQDSLDIIASGIVLMNARDARLIADLRSKMTTIYSSANISVPEMNLSAQGEKEFGFLMGKFRDPEILKYIWKSWRLQVGETTRSLFLKLVDLVNKAARENGYKNVASSWRSELGSDDILDVVLPLWNDVKILYAHLHAYTHHKLKLFYGEKLLNDKNYIPAHLLGSLWGDNWEALDDLLKPYPEESHLNLTTNFISKNYTVYDIVRKAEEFYITAGLSPMEIGFWEKSMFIKPPDGRLVDCHPVSYDFALKNDFRIRMCGEVKEQSFMEAIHEMGHVQYYMAYHHLPMLYRNAANSAFHEAVGETMVYASLSPICLKLMKITESAGISREMFLNNLMKQALSKFVLLPWALTVEMWRYNLLAGKLTENNMNKNWWNLRKKFQGIEPPDPETEKLFDAGTKYHIINNIPYMRYFISRFLEHQFLEALCNISGQNIHACCFLKNKAAGRRLKKMLALGSALPWPDALQILTGQRQLSARPLLKYYMPLYLWLVEYNRYHNITVTS